jgi:hypothetical protein
MASVRQTVIYLEDWQITLVKEVLGVDCDRWEIDFKSDPVVRYMVRFPEAGDKPRMYLTDWQRRQLKDELGVGCEFIELTGGSGLKYHVPTS